MNGSGNDEKKKLNLEETLILLFSEGRERGESLLYWEGIFPMDEAKFLADLLPRMRHIKIQVRNLL